jgi:hypothetical protein
VDTLVDAFMQFDPRQCPAFTTARVVPRRRWKAAQGALASGEDRSASAHSGKDAQIVSLLALVDDHGAKGAAPLLEQRLMAALREQHRVAHGASRRHASGELPDPCQARSY